jgi:hypothetical protein
VADTQGATTREKQFFFLYVSKNSRFFRKNGVFFKKGLATTRGFFVPWRLLMNDLGRFWLF